MSGFHGLSLDLHLGSQELPCLVLIPGLACDHTAWQPLLPSLSRHARCWVPPPAVHYRIADMAAAVLKAVPAERFALAGHSLGGRIGLEVVRQAPQRVTHLALLDTAVHPLAEGAAGATEQKSRTALVDLARRDGMRAMGERWAPPMLHPSQLGQPVYQKVLEMVEQQTIERFSAQQAALLSRPDAGPLLGQISCPTLVLCGRQDTWSTVAQHEEIAHRIPGSRLVIIEDCGHMCTLEQPEAVAAALLEWMAVGVSDVHHGRRAQGNAKR